MSRIRNNKNTMARKADRHRLYEDSVQDPEAELDFVAETFESLTGRPLNFIREDFCGTANTASWWVADDPAHRAVGVDIDADVLGWGQKHHIEPLPAAARSRIELVHGDVLSVETPRVDALLAMNFSYYLFTTRASMLAYFRRAREFLVEDGVLFLDAFGGYEAYRELEERTEYDDFTYVWDQASFDPITHAMRCEIHFEFPDGSEMRRAFVYDWRLWTLPEITELLTEAGFSKVDVYWEGTDEDTGEGNGLYKPATVGDADAGWICYVVARR